MLSLGIFPLVVFIIDNNFATKDDLERFKLALQAEMKYQISSQTLKLGSMIVISVPIIVALVGLLPKI